jgi:hypothetical protein
MKIACQCDALFQALYLPAECPSCGEVHGVDLRRPDESLVAFASRIAAFNATRAEIGALPEVSRRA